MRTKPIRISLSCWKECKYDSSHSCRERELTLSENQLSAFHITHEDIEVFSGIKTLAFAEEYKKRLGFIQAWATAETDLSIYTMDLAPWKDMLGELLALMGCFIA